VRKTSEFPCPVMEKLIFVFPATVHIMEKAPDKTERRYCAFLRGINVGGHTLIRMDELREAFESLGFKGVKTVLASGNVVFQAPQKDTAEISGNIAGMLRRILGREVLVIVHSLDELRELEARQPFKDVRPDAKARKFVTFLSEDLKARSRSGQLVGDDFQVLIVSDGAICSVLYDRPGVGTPELMSVIEKVYGRNVTTRTWDTITKVLRAGDN